MIVVILEALAGVLYLINIIAYLLAYSTLDLASILFIALMLVSFLIAYGLWKLFRWAWVTSFVLSLFGVISTAFILAISGAPQDALFVAIPSIANDTLVIAILLTGGVRRLFWGRVKTNP